jgi:hypothetical protein
VGSFHFPPVTRRKSSSSILAVWNFIKVRDRDKILAYSQLWISSILRFLPFTTRHDTDRTRAVTPAALLHVLQVWKYTEGVSAATAHPLDEIHLSPIQNTLWTGDLPISGTAISELPLPRQALTTVLGPKKGNDNVFICEIILGACFCFKNE